VRLSVAGALENGVGLNFAKYEKSITFGICIMAKKTVMSSPNSDAPSDKLDMLLS
jgi:hypothetical protein